jgi:hypothetical protein
MFRLIRNSHFVSFLWFLLAIQILNVSVDSPDSHSDVIAENLSTNDLESVIEMLLEKVFDFENAILEHDESDNEIESSQFKITFNLFFACLSFFSIQAELFNQKGEKIWPIVKFNNRLSIDDLTPPPKD